MRFSMVNWNNLVQNMGFIAFYSNCFKQYELHYEEVLHYCLMRIFECLLTVFIGFVAVYTQRSEVGPPISVPDQTITVSQIILLSGAIWISWEKLVHVAVNLITAQAGFQDLTTIPECARNKIEICRYIFESQTQEKQIIWSTLHVKKWTRYFRSL